VRLDINLNEVCQQMNHNWHPMDGALVCGGSFYPMQDGW